MRLIIHQVCVVNQCGQKFKDAMGPYRDGRVMTRVFMGVDDTNSNWKAYGEHPY